jgi:hypothetical protein
MYSETAKKFMTPVRINENPDSGPKSVRVLGIHNRVQIELGCQEMFIEMSKGYGYPRKR